MLRRLGFTLLALCGVGVVVGCGPTSTSISEPPSFVAIGPGALGLVDPNTPLFGGTVTKSASRAYPIIGGTLTVTRDGKTAVAADPDRGRVFLADLATKEVRQVVVDENDEVGRVVEGESGTVYVVARRSGAILRIDVPSGALQRFPVCNAPRGVAFDSIANQVHVACASGLLVSLDPQSGAVVRKLRLQDQNKDDLRDIVMHKDQLVITRFRSSEILTLDATGNVVNSVVPSPAFTGPSTLAFRAVANGNDGVVVVHQSSSNNELGTGPGAYYGGHCGGSVADTFLTTVSSGSSQTYYGPNTIPLAGATGPLDIAVSPDGLRTVIVATGNSWTLASASLPSQNPRVQQLQAQRPTVQVIEAGSAGSIGGCWDTQAKTLDEPGEAVAVAFDANGKYVVQYREPAKLILEDRSQIVHQILLSTDSRADTGLALFHVNSSGGISCASCHPGGDVDGHVWKFTLGPRVTQPLQGKVSQRAPFHWSGDLANWDSVIDEVMMKRMSMPFKPTADQSQALLSWLDTIPNAPAPDDIDQDAVGRGKVVFQDAQAGCTSCHMGSIYSDNKLHDVGTGGSFVAPSLVGVGARAPLMHDGCAATLMDRFNVASCGGGDLHGKTSQLSTTQKADLTAFLKSL